MPVAAEQKILESYCVGRGANIGCGRRPIGDSIGVDLAEGPCVSVIAPAHQLPFKSGELDYIVSCAALEHIDVAPITVLREWTRCVKLGGVVALLVPDADYGMWAMTGDTGVPGCLIKPRREMEHLHAFTLTTLNLLGRFAGLEVKEAYKFSRQPVRRETTLVWVGTRGEHFRE